MPYSTPLPFNALSAQQLVLRAWRDSAATRIRVVLRVRARHDHAPGVVAAEQEHADERLVVAEAGHARGLREDRARGAAERVQRAAGCARPKEATSCTCGSWCFPQRCTAYSGEVDDAGTAPRTRAAPALVAGTRSIAAFASAFERRRHRSRRAACRRASFTSASESFASADLLREVHARWRRAATRARSSSRTNDQVVEDVRHVRVQVLGRDLHLGRHEALVGDLAGRRVERAEEIEHRGRLQRPLAERGIHDLPTRYSPLAAFAPYARHIWVRRSSGSFTLPVVAVTASRPGFRDRAGSPSPRRRGCRACRCRRC